MKYFGTDGIRGTYGELQISEPFFRALGMGVAEYMARRAPDGKIVVGGDTRASTDSLKAAFLEGLSEGGFKNAEDVGVLPTPALAYCVLKRGAYFGAMITASHNPHTDNGIKFFDSAARKVEDDVQLEFESLLEKHLCGVSAYTPKTFLGRKIGGGEFAKNEYVEKLSSIFEPDFLKGMKIAIDMANGATSNISSEVFARYGAEVFKTGCEPTGLNINDGVGSQHPESIRKLCLETGADVGFAHDGDGDRVLVCDETGSILEGEEVLGLIALDALERGKLSSNAIVTTLQSNTGMDESLKAHGIDVFRSGIGDRLVMRLMLEKGCNIGGENSGHFIFTEISPCGDGLAAALALLSVIKRGGGKLSKLRGGIKMYESKSAAVKVARKTPVGETKNLSKAIAECAKILGSEGRTLVRYSGTEKKIRLLAEGKDPSKVEKCMQLLEKAVEIDLK